MAVDEVINWDVVARDNIMPIPPGPDGRRAARVGLSLQEMMASIARYRDTLSGSTGTLLLSADEPWLALNEEDASLDNKYWDIIPITEQLRMRAVNDAQNVFTNWLTVDRTGTAIDAINFGAEVTVEGAISTPTRAHIGWDSAEGAQVGGQGSVNDITIQNDINQSVLHIPTGTRDVHITAGDLICTGGSIEGIDYLAIDSINPYITWHDSDAAADEKYWMAQYQSGQWKLKTLTDLAGAGADAISIERTGTVVDTIDLLAATDITLDSDVIVTGSFTSSGFVDTATGVRLQLSNGATTVSTVGQQWSWDHAGTNSLQQFNGGVSTATGASMWLYGSTHPTAPGDFYITEDGNLVFYWDGTLGTINLYTGAGSKSLALALSATQHAVFSQTVTVEATAIIDSAATGDPKLDFHQDGVTKAYIQYLDATDNLRLETNLDSAIEFYPFDTLALVIDSAASTFSNTIVTPAATTVLAPLNIPHGTAPTSPTDGDMWTTTAGLYVRINGSTVGPLS